MIREARGRRRPAGVARLVIVAALAAAVPASATHAKLKKSEEAQPYGGMYVPNGMQALGMGYPDPRMAQWAAAPPMQQATGGYVWVPYGSPVPYQGAGVGGPPLAMPAQPAMQMPVASLSAAAGAGVGGPPLAMPAQPAMQMPVASFSAAAEPAQPQQQWQSQPEQLQPEQPQPEQAPTATLGAGAEPVGFLAGRNQQDLARMPMSQRYGMQVEQPHIPANLQAQPLTQAQAQAMQGQIAALKTEVEKNRDEMWGAMRLVAQTVDHDDETMKQVIRDVSTLRGRRGGGMPIVTTDCSSRQSSCDLCTAAKDCVWCKVEQRCYSGDSVGPLRGECSLYLHGQCQS